jgi:hypothetical protein
MSCFNIPLESALYKLQNAGKNRISGNHWKYIMKETLEIQKTGHILHRKNN